MSPSPIEAGEIHRRYTIATLQVTRTIPYLAAAYLYDTNNAWGSIEELRLTHPEFFI